MEHPPEFVFAYGSLVSPASAASTIGHDLAGYAPARLDGMRRAWTVGSDAGSHPERMFLRADGSEFTGVTVVLGLEPVARGDCHGAVLAVSADDLALLDLRERNYHRVDVTGRVRWAGRPAAHTVWAYLPRARATARLRSGRELRVRAEYLSDVEAAFAAIGRLGDYRRGTPPVPVQIERLRVAPSAGSN